MFRDVDGRQTLDEDAQMSDGNEFQRSGAATGNVRRPTVVSRNGDTSSWCDDADRTV